MDADLTKRVAGSVERLRAELEFLEALDVHAERDRRTLTAALCQLQFAIDLLDQTQVPDP